MALFESLVEKHTPVSDPLRVARRLYLLYEGALLESRIHQEDWPIREARALVPTLIAS